MIRPFAPCPALCTRMPSIRLVGLCLLIPAVLVFSYGWEFVDQGNIVKAASVSAVPFDAPACDYYASPTALANGTGTISNPWTLQTALNKTQTIVAGHTLCLQGGTYHSKYQSILNGVTVRAAPNEFPVIDGYVYTTLAAAIDATQTTISVADASAFVTPRQLGDVTSLIVEGEALWISSFNGNTITVVRAAAGSSTAAVPHAAGTLVRLAGSQLASVGSNSTYRDLEIKNSDPLRNWQTDGAEGLRGSGIFNTGIGNKFINLVVHDNLSGIFSGSASSNTEIYGCLSYNNGMDDPIADPPGKGHGMYLENAAGFLKVYDNIVLNNYNNGTQLYGRSATSVGGDLEGNVFANSGAPLAGVPGMRNRNLILGTETQRIPDILVEDNYLFHPHNVLGYNTAFGYGEGIDDGHVLNNCFIGGSVGLEITGASHVTVSGNKFYTTNSQGVNIQAREWPYTIDNNSYYAVQSTAREFGDMTLLQTLIFSAWKLTTGFDATSTITSSPMPDTVIVRPNAYQTGRANIIVYTSSGASSMPVNLSQANLTSGQSYVIQNAFNYPGAPIASGVFNPALPTINLPLSGGSTLVATPLASAYTPATTLPQFGAFILIPTTAASTTPTNTPTPSATATNTATPTPTVPPAALIGGTVRYGNAGGSTRYVSNVLITGTGSLPASVITNYPWGAYLLGVGLGNYTVTPSKTGGQNGAVNSFDAARVSQYASGLITFNAAQRAAGDVTGNGSVNSFDAAQVARYAANLPPYGMTGRWVFSPAIRSYTSSINLSDEDYSALLMGEVSGNWTNTGSRAATGGSGPETDIIVTAPAVTTPAGSEISIPLRIEGAAGRALISYEFELRYDPAVLQPSTNAVQLGETVSHRLSVIINGDEAGRLRVVVYGALPVEGDGVLLNLKLVSVGSSGTSSPLTLEHLVFNEGLSRTLSVDGHVEISPAK
jgi:Cohesin domain/Dockerin type I domain